MRTQESKKKNDVIVLFVYMLAQVVEYPVVKSRSVQDKNSAGNKNEYYQGADKQAYHDCHFHR